jgi:hypothetical protein
MSIDVPTIKNMNCIHCKKPNSENWFYCKNCGKRASSPLFTTNMFMMSEKGKRSDIEFNTISLDEHVASEVAQRESQQKEFWKEKVNAVR